MCSSDLSEKLLVAVVELLPDVRDARAGLQHPKRAEVVIDGVWIPDQNLAAYFKDLHTQSPEKTLVIKGDKALKYKDVRKIMEIVKEMLTSRDMMVRRLREGVEFFQFLKNREDMIVS